MRKRARAPRSPRASNEGQRGVADVTNTHPMSAAVKVRDRRARRRDRTTTSRSRRRDVATRGRDVGDGAMTDAGRAIADNHLIDAIGDDDRGPRASSADARAREDARD